MKEDLGYVLSELRKRARTWKELSEEERAALLIDLGMTFRKNQLQVQLPLPAMRTGLRYATAAVALGKELLKCSEVPFQPDPPFKFAEVRPWEVVQRFEQVTAWVTEEFDEETRSLDALHGLLDLKMLGRELLPHLEKWRGVQG